MADDTQLSINGIDVSPKKGFAALSYGIRVMTIVFIVMGALFLLCICACLFRRRRKTRYINDPNLNYIQPQLHNQVNSHQQTNNNHGLPVEQVNGTNKPASGRV